MESKSLLRKSRSTVRKSKTRSPVRKLKTKKSSLPSKEATSKKALKVPPRKTPEVQKVKSPESVYGSPKGTPSAKAAESSSAKSPKSGPLKRKSELDQSTIQHSTKKLQRRESGKVKPLVQPSSSKPAEEYKASSSSVSMDKPTCSSVPQANVLQQSVADPDPKAVTRQRCDLPHCNEKCAEVSLASASSEPIIRSIKEMTKNVKILDGTARDLSSSSSSLKRSAKSVSTFVEEHTKALRENTEVMKELVAALQHYPRQDRRQSSWDYNRSQVKDERGFHYKRP